MPVKFASHQMKDINISKENEIRLVDMGHGGERCQSIGRHHLSFLGEEVVLAKTSSVATP